MALILSDEQTLLRESAGEFLRERAGADALRKLRDEGSETPGYCADLWRNMAELGWPGILVPESSGGLGFGHVGMGQVAEHCGRSLAISPLFATAIAGASAVVLAGSDENKADILPGVADGSLTLALALDESSRHAPERVDCLATKRDGGYVLTGRKRFVVDGHSADRLIVAARTGQETGDDSSISLFVVERRAAGLTATRTAMVDSSNAAIVDFDNVHADTASMLGDEGSGNTTLENILDIANAHLAAELLGIASESFDRAVQYMKERKQFGIPIGSFQGLQHRAAWLWTEIELVKSIVLGALQALDENDPDSAALCSAAKAKACRTAELATNEALQLHGGIGMTDEADLGFFLKRARVLQALFGDHRYHCSRYARLNGY